MHDGNLPSLKLLLMIIFRGSEIQFISPLVSLFGIESNPEEFLGCKSFIICCISSVVISLNEKVSSGWGVFRTRSSAGVSDLGIVLARSGAKFT